MKCTAAVQTCPLAWRSGSPGTAVPVWGWQAACHSVSVERRCCTTPLSQLRNQGGGMPPSWPPWLALSGWSGPQRRCGQRSRTEGRSRVHSKATRGISFVYMFFLSVSFLMSPLGQMKNGRMKCARMEVKIYSFKVLSALDKWIRITIQNNISLFQFLLTSFSVVCRGWRMYEMSGGWKAALLFPVFTEAHLEKHLIKMVGKQRV